jgi:hypothetical protein
MKVIYNGALIDLKDSQCDDKGWMKGSGVFETIKTVDNFAVGTFSTYAPSGYKFQTVRIFHRQRG